MEQTPQRFSTLDVFRGLTVFIMIVVNTPGSGAVPYAPLLHAGWHGCTLTDLVFPSFLFAIGNAMPFAQKKWQDKSDTYILSKILKRTVLLFFVGHLLTWYTSMHFVNGRIAFVPFAQTRILAVLQRIALCYGAAALLVHYFTPRRVVVISIFFLLLYWVLLYAFGASGAAYTIEGNFVRKIDLAVLSAPHMYREGGIVFDPEGLLSTLPAIVNVTAGYLAACFILKKGKTRDGVVTLLLAGAVLITFGLVWQYWFPFNKKLWTSSYVLYTTGIDLVVLAFLFYAIELKKWKRCVFFFSVLGKNPLAVYVLSNLLLFVFILNITPDKIFIDWINEIAFQKLAPGPLGSLLFALCFTLLCWLAAWLMDKQKIYVRL